MALWKHKKAHDWRYEFQYQGQRYTGAGFKTKGTARAAREEHRKRVKKELQEVNSPRMAFSKLTTLYLDYSKRRFTEKMYKYKAHVYRSFVSFAGDCPIDKITPQTLHYYLNTCPTNNNYNAHRKELSAIFSFARKRLKVLSHNPCWDIDKMPHTPAPKKIPSEEDVLKLLMASNPEGEKPLILVILHTLARIDEALRLTWQDVNFEKRTVTLWTRKRKDGAYEPNDMHMNQDLYDVLWKLWEDREQEKWVFFNEKTGSRYNRRPKMMKGICKRAGIDPFGFHALRHFMATYLADQMKASKQTIQGILRHKYLETTEIYLHSVEISQKNALQSIEGKFKLKDVCGSVCGFVKNATNKSTKN